MEAGMTKLQAAVFAESEKLIKPEQRRHIRRIGATIQCWPYCVSVRLHRRIRRIALCWILPMLLLRGWRTRQPTLCCWIFLGLERLYGTAAKMAGDLASRVSAIGIEANIAMAANPDAAMHAARGFTGTTIIPAGEEAHRLGVLPLRILLDAFDISSPEKPGGKSSIDKREQLHEQMLDTLERWGVRDFRMLGLLPEHALASRLGEAGAKLRRLALGEGMRTLALCDPAAAI